MSIETDQAVVLRLTEFSETSQIVTLFTDGHGLLRLIAKGIRRSTRARFAVGLDLLELGEVRFIAAHGDAQLGTLTEWVQREGFLGLRRERVRLYGGLYAAELTAQLTEEADPHPELFAALTVLLASLAGPDEPGPPLVRFQRDLLRAIGYAPNLRTCVDCHQPMKAGQPAFFSSGAGGVLCRNCERRHSEKRRLPARLVAGAPGPHDPAEWFALFDYHLTHIAGRPFQTATTVRRLLSAATKARPTG